MEQNQELKNKPKHVRSNNIWQGTQEYFSLFICGAGKTG